MPDVTINRKGKTYILRDISNSNAVVESTDSHSEGTDVYWNYSCASMHDGDAIHVAVKNVHYEPDYVGESLVYEISHEGMFWADDLSALDDDICDWYSDAIMEVAKEDYNELD